MIRKPFAAWRSKAAYAAGGAAVVIVLACGGGRAPGSLAPSASPRETIQTFMRAVTDSNLTRMTELWGSPKGSAARTGEPSDYQQRIVLIQSYLRHDDYRIAADVGEGEGRRGMQVELRRQACTWSVPFTVINSGREGWIVSSIDLTRAGNPARPCDPNTRRDSMP